MNLSSINVILPVLSSKKLNMTIKTKTKHIASRANPNAQLVEMNAYQHAA